MSSVQKLSYSQFYPTLVRALDAVWAQAGSRGPVGSDRILAWIVANEPDVVDELRARGYADADDKTRTGWSWRQYLGNALARMSRDGRVLLRGHSVEVPDGYYGPVGLWSPALRPSVEEATRPVSLRLSETTHDRISRLAAGQGVTFQETVDRLLQSHPAVRLGLAMDRRPEDWMSFLAGSMAASQADAGVPLPLPQGNTIWLAWALALRVAEALDGPARSWSVCARPATLDALCGPNQLVARVAPSSKQWTYEEDADITLFTSAGGRDWPLLSVESEGASYTEVGPKWGRNDYMWDFYKLFRQKSGAVLMVARVAGEGRVDNVEARMEQLSETFENAVLLPYQHLLWVGQPVLVVILPGARHDRALLGVAVAPGPMMWEWSGSGPSVPGVET